MSFRTPPYIHFLWWFGRPWPQAVLPYNINWPLCRDVPIYTVQFSMYGDRPKDRECPINHTFGDPSSLSMCCIASRQLVLLIPLFFLKPNRHIPNCLLSQVGQWQLLLVAVAVVSRRRKERRRRKRRRRRRAKRNPMMTWALAFLTSSILICQEFLTICLMCTFKIFCMGPGRNQIWSLGLVSDNH